MAVISAPAIVSPPRHVRILYADDMPELREVARISFSRDGHGIECVADGALALQRIVADAGFDLVITDHHMPNMNGLELVRRLRDVGYPGRIIVFSSELGAEVAAEYVKLQVDRVVYKPVYPTALRQLIAELFPEPARGAARSSFAPAAHVARH